MKRKITSALLVLMALFGACAKNGGSVTNISAADLIVLSAQAFTLGIDGTISINAKVADKIAGITWKVTSLKDGADVTTTVLNSLHTNPVTFNGVEPGSYRVDVVVVDRDGNYGGGSASFDVLDPGAAGYSIKIVMTTAGPIAVATRPQDRVGIPQFADASNHVFDLTSTVFDGATSAGAVYKINWGDGSGDLTIGNPASFNHTFNGVGNKNGKITIISGDTTPRTATLTFAYFVACASPGTLGFDTVLAPSAISPGHDFNYFDFDFTGLATNSIVANGTKIAVDVNGDGIVDTGFVSNADLGELYTVYAGNRTVAVTVMDPVCFNAQRFTFTKDFIIPRPPASTYFWLLADWVGIGANALPSSNGAYVATQNPGDSNLSHVRLDVSSPTNSPFRTMTLYGVTQYVNGVEHGMNIVVQFYDATGVLNPPPDPGGFPRMQLAHAITDQGADALSSLNYTNTIDCPVTLSVVITNSQGTCGTAGGEVDHTVDLSGTFSCDPMTSGSLGVQALNGSFHAMRSIGTGCIGGGQGGGGNPPPLQ